MKPVKVEQTIGPNLRAKIIAGPKYRPYVVIYEKTKDENHVAYLEGREMTRLAKAWLKSNALTDTEGK